MNKSKKMPIFRLYHPFLKADWKFLVGSFLLWIIFIPVLRVLIVLFPQQVMNSIAKGNAVRVTLCIVLGFQVVMTCIPVFESFFNSLIRDKEMTRIDGLIKEGIYRRAHRTDYKYVDNPDYYEKYTWTIEKQPDKSREAFELINQLISCGVVIVSMIGLLLTINGWIIGLAVVGMIFRMIGYISYNKIELEEDAEILKHDRRMAYVHRVFYLKDYGQDLRTTNLFPIIMGKFRGIVDEKLKLIQRYGLKKCFWMVYVDLVYRFFYTAIIVLVVYTFAEGRIADAAEYVTIMLAIDRLDECLYSFFSLFQEAIKLNEYAKLIESFYRNESLIEKEEAGEPITNVPFSVNIHNMCFSYPKTEYKLSNVNLHIKPGEHVGIVGENGVGKTTLVKLLLRLYDPDQGDIQVNGRALKEYNLRDYREKVGVVFQNSNLYSLTLKENFKIYGEVESNTIKRVLCECGLQTIADEKLLNNVMTKEFDEEGLVLSEGQLQRLHIAEMLSHKYGLIICDEASSALDPLSEQAISKLVEEKTRGTTTLIIAHRLSCVRDMDRIIVLGKNGVIEEGTHDELMEKNGQYRMMFLAQAEKYKD